MQFANSIELNKKWLALTSSASAYLQTLLALTFWNYIKFCQSEKIDCWRKALSEQINKSEYNKVKQTMSL